MPQPRNTGLRCAITSPRTAWHRERGGICLTRCRMRCTERPPSGCVDAHLFHHGLVPATSSPHVVFSGAKRTVPRSAIFFFILCRPTRSTFFPRTTLFLFFFKTTPPTSIHPFPSHAAFRF